MKKAIAFSASKSSDTRNSETGAEEYTIPASNAFGLPHRFPVWQSAAACQGEFLKPSENKKRESNNVEVYLWSISRWHYRSKTSGKAVKTAEQTARTSIKTSEQTANASV